MNELQKRIFKHLTVPDHPRRLECLEDLMGAWNTQFVMNPYLSEELTMKYLGQYLEANPRGFCQDGIQRLWHAVNKPVNTIRIVLDLEYQGEEAGVIGSEFKEALVGFEYGSTNRHKIVKARVAAYEIGENVCTFPALGARSHIRWGFK